jgi:site-specific recombinase XerD
MQEVRGYKPSTVARRLSVLVGFYRTCVIDAVLDHSPADHVRHPPVPPVSPTLGLSHLQFETMLAAGRTSHNVNDFALVALLGLLGLRISEATGASVEDLGEAHGPRVLRVHGKGDKIALVPLPPAVGRAVDRAIEGRDHGPLLGWHHVTFLRSWVVTAVSWPVGTGTFASGAVRVVGANMWSQGVTPGGEFTCP